MNSIAPSIIRDAFPNSWYPVCTSRQLKSMQPIAIRVLGTEWVAFRGVDGNCSVVQRFCCHMGTDLALGKVVDNALRCPLHHWSFDGDGHCLHIPGATRIPARAGLRKLHSTERFGIVFVSNSPDVPFGFPSFADASCFASSLPRVVPMRAPYFAVTLNLFDVQHLTTVHQRRLHEPPRLFSSSPGHLGITYSAYNVKERFGNYLARWLGFSANNIRVDCWGGNLLLIAIEGRRPDFIMALAPVNDHSCHLYMATVDGSPAANPLREIARKLKLEFAALLTRAFITEDIRIVSNARTSAGVLLTDQDAEVIRFWKYFHDLPTSQLPVPP